MYVSHLSLVNFRSHKKLDLEFKPGLNLIYGKNGVGKTNIVEALNYLSNLKSHRVTNDHPLINRISEQALIKGRIVKGEKSSTLELEITAGKSNRARINRGQVTQAKNVLGVFKCVMFAPEHITIVKGDPDDRRSFLDDLAIQLRPTYAAVLSDFNKVLKQRNALLKSAMQAARSNRSFDISTLEIWNEKFVLLSTQLSIFRIRIVREMLPHLNYHYQEISDVVGSTTMKYSLSFGQIISSDTTASEQEFLLLKDKLAAALKEISDQELARGTSLLGAQRDDLLLYLNDFPVKGFASNGESWSMALALKMASFKLFVSVPSQSFTGEEDLWFVSGENNETPVLILDDVFSELDDERRNNLLSFVDDIQQVIVTAAAINDVPNNYRMNKIELFVGEEVTDVRYE